MVRLLEAVSQPAVPKLRPLRRRSEVLCRGEEEDLDLALGVDLGLDLDLDLDLVTRGPAKAQKPVGVRRQTQSIRSMQKRS